MMRIDAKTHGDTDTLQALGATSLFEVRNPESNVLLGWDALPDVDLSKYDVKLLAVKGPILIAAASSACDAVAAQIVPSVAQQSAYTNAAGLVAASGGGAPSTEPFKSVFAALGAAVGISDPATFAKVVSSTSLASMQLVTILGMLKGGVAKAMVVADLSNALTAFEQALAGFVSGLNKSGLTAEIKAPDAIVISGING
jgi:hypothetical protein